MKGKFIVVEGVDFTGKTTQVRKIENLLRNLGASFKTTREPGGTKLGERVREIVLASKEEDEPAKQAILLLFMASRAENIAKVILPALEAGINVICDRFLASTLVYQGVLSGFQREDILKTHDSFNYALYPDLTILLDAEPETLFKRRANAYSTRQNNKYDFLPLETFIKLREEFLKTSQIPELNTCIVNSERSPDKTFEEISFQVRKILSL